MLENLDTLEDRIKNPAYLLFVVVTLLLLIISLVNIISFDGYGEPVLGKFSIIHIVTLVIMISTIIGWAALLWRPNDDRWLQWTLDKFATNPIFFFGMCLVYAVVLWHMFTASTWLNLPALWFALFFMMLIFGAMVLFRESDTATLLSRTRKGLIYLLAGLVVLEIVVQLLAAARLLPSISTDTTPVSPYDRLYYVNEEGETVDSLANSLGYHYPEFRLADESHRVILLGDQIVQGLEVPATDNFGVLLDKMIIGSGSSGEASEVIALGHPDLGPGVFLNVPLWLNFEEAFKPDEVIIFLDFNNDFQLIRASDGNLPYFYLEDGAVTISEDDFWLRHEILHEALWGLDGYQPRRFLRSHYLSYRLAWQFFSSNRPNPADLVPAPQADIPLPNSFVFYEESSIEPLNLMQEHVRLFVEHARQQGIKVSIITIPVFAENFYEQAESDAWSTQFGAADLFLPEREMRAFAEQNDIPFLALGELMRQTDLTTSDIEALYYSPEAGGLTQAGHAFVAQAVFDCFFQSELDSQLGCDRYP